MKVVVADTEGDNYRDKSTKLWIFGGKELDTGRVYRFHPFIWTEKERLEAIAWAKTVDLWVFHNGIEHDLPEINRYVQQDLIHPDRVLDTLIVSRLLNYGRPGHQPHSFKSLGKMLGVYKGDFNNFSEFSQEMVDYWHQDLEVGEAILRWLGKYIFEPHTFKIKDSWKKAIEVEHKVQQILTRQENYGFYFDKEKAEELLVSVQEEMAVLEEEIKKDYPRELQLVNTLAYRKTKDGQEFATVKKAKDKYPITKVDGDFLLCYDYEDFNPGSPKQRVEKLWGAGWKPYDKTMTHQKFGRVKVGDPYGSKGVPITKDQHEEKTKHFNFYGWKVNEDNLRTLPSDAPQGAQRLAEWLTLEGRRSSLAEWIGQVREDNRIHGNTKHIGAWTGRGAHKNPNTANIASVFSGEPRTAVDRIKSRFDASLRTCWTVPRNVSAVFLVGVDADGIQLRILADYLWRLYGKDDYAQAIRNGSKEDGTDIHNVNRKALGLEHVTRDMAKTFN